MLLTVIGISTVLVLMLAFVIISYFIEQGAIKDSLTKTADEVATRLGQSLTRPMWNYEYQTVQLSIQVDARAPDISWIILRDDAQLIQSGILKQEDGRVVTDSLAIHQILSGAQAFYSSSRPLLYQGERIGTIEVAVNDIQRQRDFFYRIVNIAFTQFGLSLLVMLAIIVCIRLFIVQRLLHLQRGVMAFGHAGFATRIVEPRMDEIGQLAEQFNTMAETIHAYSTNLENQVKERTAQLVESEKLAFLGSLVAGIAHEINTPVGICLTAITYVESRVREIKRQYDAGQLSKTGFDQFMSELERSDQMIISNLNRASELVRTFRGIGADQLKDDCRVFNLGSYLLEVIFSLGPKLRTMSHDIVVDCPQDLNIRSYPSAFYQIISNLVINSVTHGFDDGRSGNIRIEVRVESNQLWLVYRDDGLGIPSEILPSIFNPFFTTKRGQGGTGLGLYIAYTLINKLHGTIMCNSETGKGVAFTIKLPMETLV